MKQFLVSNKPRLFFLISLVLIMPLVAIGVFFGLKVRKNNSDGSIAVVAGRKITQQDLSKEIYGMSFSGTVESPETVDEATRQQLRDYLIEKEVIKAKAKELDIVATEDEINTEISTSFESETDKKDGLLVFARYTAEQKNLAKENIIYRVLVAKIKEKALAWNEGDYMLVRFDKYFSDLPEISKVAMKDESQRESLNVDLRKKAEAVAKRLDTDLKSGKDWEDVYASLASDKEVGYPALDPTTPTMSGSINKESYFGSEGLDDLAAYKLFNEVAAQNNNKTTSPLLLKDDNGKELPFYVIYRGKNLKDGYQWGYRNWLNEQKKNLVKMSVGSLDSILKTVLKPVSSTANAFNGDICGTSGFGHGFCSDIYIYYINRGGVEIPIKGQGMKIEGYTGKLSMVNSAGVQKEKIYPVSTTNGHYYMSYLSVPSYALESHNQYGKVFVNCNVTGAYYITLTGGAPVVAGTTGTGTWSHSYGFDTPAHLQNYWEAGTINPRARVCLRSTSDCAYSDTMKTANGKSGWHKFKWNPNWVTTAPLTANVYEINADGSTTLRNIGNVGKITNNNTPNIDCGNGGSTCAINANVGTAYTFIGSAGTNYALSHWALNGVTQSGTWNRIVTPVDATPITINAYFRRVTAPGLSCTVSPNTGETPLSVTVTSVVTPTAVTGNTYNYAMGDLVGSFAGRGSSVEYNYKTAGSYIVHVTESTTGTEADCTPNPINVTAPSGTTGGEVAP